MSPAYRDVRCVEQDTGRVVTICIVASVICVSEPALVGACTGKAVPYFDSSGIGCVAYQTTVGWSLLTSGLVTLLLFVLPGESVWWGIGLLLAGLVILAIRRDDVAEALEAGI